MKKNRYELMVIIKPLIPDNVRLGVESRIVEILENGEGKVHKTESWGRKRLAYRISHYNEGYYVLYSFENFSNSIGEIMSSLKANDNILRFLLVKVD